MLRMTPGIQKEAEQRKLRYFFAFVRYVAYAAMVFTLTFCLSGCALIGLLLKLAPLAAVVVEYSPPLETEDGNILCVKSLRYVEGGGEDIRIVKSEYFLVILDDKGTEIAGQPLEIGNECFAAENFRIDKNDKNIFTLSFASEEITRKWKFAVVRPPKRVGSSEYTLLPR